MKLYVFNPDSDMALAHNDENYMAPAPIRQMEHDLAFIADMVCTTRKCRSGTFSL